jgi:hypothetical protein
MTSFLLEIRLIRSVKSLEFASRNAFPLHLISPNCPFCSAILDWNNRRAWDIDQRTNIKKNKNKKYFGKYFISKMLPKILFRKNIWKKYVISKNILINKYILNIRVLFPY